MEGCPRSLMLNLELKDSQPTSFTATLKKYIREFYQEDDNLYSNQCSQLDQLRMVAIKPTYDNSGCSILRRYYGQIYLLKSRFPMDEASAAAIDFTWTDSYTEDPITIGDISYEKTSILFNLGALHSLLGSREDRVSEEGMKVACTHYQSAAGVFNYIKENFSTDQYSDTSRDLLNLYINVMLGQAQECLLEKSMLDNRKNSLVSRIAMQVQNYYTEAIACLSSSYGDILPPKMHNYWNKLLQIKCLYLNAIAYMYMGNLSEEQGKYGETVAFMKLAAKKMNEANKMSKNQPKQMLDLLQFITDVVGQKLDSCKRDNDFIYHEAEPEFSALPEIKGASLVKPIAFQPFDANTEKDIFEKLIPMKAHESASLYSEEKANIVRRYSSLVVEKDKELSSWLASMQIDDLLRPEDADALPDELTAKCKILQDNPGAIKKVTEMLSKLKKNGSDLDDKIKETLRKLTEIINQQKTLAEKYGLKFDDTKFQKNLEDVLSFQKKRDAAQNTNVELGKAFENQRSNLEVMIGPEEALSAMMPSQNILDTPIEDDAVQKIRDLIGKVDKMKKQRVELFDKLRKQINDDDITHLIATTDVSDFQSLFKDQLKKHDSSCELLQCNLDAQEKIMNALTQANAKYAHARQSVADIKAKRDAVVKTLVASFDFFISFKEKVSDGVTFYNQLSEIFTKREQEITDLCKEESEKLKRIEEKAKKFKEERERKSQESKNIPNQPMETHGNPRNPKIPPSYGQQPNIPPVYPNVPPSSLHQPPSSADVQPRPSFPPNSQPPNQIPQFSSMPQMRPSLPHLITTTPRMSYPHPPYSSTSPPIRPVAPSWHSGTDQISKPPDNQQFRMPLGNMPPNAHEQKYVPSGQQQIPYHPPPSQGDHSIRPQHGDSGLSKPHGGKIPLQQYGDRLPQNIPYQRPQMYGQPHGQAVPTRPPLPRQPPHMNQPSHQPRPAQPGQQFHKPMVPHQIQQPPSLQHHIPPHMNTQQPPPRNPVPPLRQPQPSSQYQIPPRQPLQSPPPQQPTRPQPPSYNVAQGYTATSYQPQRPSSSHQPRNPIIPRAASLQDIPRQNTTAFHPKPEPRMQFQGARLQQVQGPRLQTPSPQQLPPGVPHQRFPAQIPQMLPPGQTRGVTHDQGPQRCPPPSYNSLSKQYPSTSQIPIHNPMMSSDDNQYQLKAKDTLPQDRTPQMYGRPSEVPSARQLHRPNSLDGYNNLQPHYSTQYQGGQMIPQHRSSSPVQQRPTQEFPSANQATSEAAKKGEVQRQLSENKPRFPQVSKPETSPYLPGGYQPETSSESKMRIQQNNSMPQAHKHSTTGEATDESNREHASLEDQLLQNLKSLDEPQAASLTTRKTKKDDSIDNTANENGVHKLQQKVLLQQQQLIEQQQRFLEQQSHGDHVLKLMEQIKSQQKELEELRMEIKVKDQFGEIERHLENLERRQASESNEAEKYKESISEDKHMFNTEIKSEVIQDDTTSPESNIGSKLLGEFSMDSFVNKTEKENSLSIHDTATESINTSVESTTSQAEAISPALPEVKPADASPNVSKDGDKKEDLIKDAPSKPPRRRPVPQKPDCVSTELQEITNAEQEVSNQHGDITMVSKGDISGASNRNSDLDVAKEDVTSPDEDNALKEKSYVLQVAKDVEVFRSRVQGLTRKQASGPNILTKEWMAVQHYQENISKLFTSDVANSNATKNRYLDILPYDHTRVILHDKGDSDYINATVIEGLTPLSPSYIASQGPIPQCFADFWLMVWQNKSPLIIMLTKEVEGKKLKCHQYWPKDEGYSMLFGSLRITMKRQTSVKFWKERLISITHNETQEVHVVEHYQFTGWPDHGVPSNLSDIFNFLGHIYIRHASVDAEMKAPVVLHCSAGVGRTGAFIVVFSAMRELYGGNGLIDVQTLVKRLREKRKFMVQKKEQYEFCYRCILYAADQYILLEHPDHAMLDDSDTSSDSDYTSSISDDDVEKPDIPERPRLPASEPSEQNSEEKSQESATNQTTKSEGSLDNLQEICTVKDTEENKVVPSGHIGVEKDHSVDEETSRHDMTEGDQVEDQGTYKEQCGVMGDYLKIDEHNAGTMGGNYSTQEDPCGSKADHDGTLKSLPGTIGDHESTTKGGHHGAIKDHKSIKKNLRGTDIDTGGTKEDTGKDASGIVYKEIMEESEDETSGEVECEVIPGLQEIEGMVCNDKGTLISDFEKEDGEISDDLKLIEDNSEVKNGSEICSEENQDGGNMTIECSGQSKDLEVPSECDGSSTEILANVENSGMDGNILPLPAVTKQPCHDMVDEDMDIKYPPKKMVSHDDNCVRMTDTVAKDTSTTENEQTVDKPVEVTKNPPHIVEEKTD